MFPFWLLNCTDEILTSVNRNHLENRSEFMAGVKSRAVTVRSRHGYEWIVHYAQIGYILIIRKVYFIILRHVTYQTWIFKLGSKKINVSNFTRSVPRKTWISKSFLLYCHLSKLSISKRRIICQCSINSQLSVVKWDNDICYLWRNVEIMLHLQPIQYGIKPTLNWHCNEQI